MKIYSWENTEEWFQQDRNNIESNFPNLPYYKD